MKNKRGENKWGGARNGAGRKKQNNPLLRVKIDPVFLVKLREAAKRENMTIGEWLCKHVQI